MSKLRIPTISCVFGASTAGGAYQPGMSDYNIFVKNQAMVALGGPPLVKMATGEDAETESLQSTLAERSAELAARSAEFEANNSEFAARISEIEARSGASGTDSVRTVPVRGVPSSKVSSRWPTRRRAWLVRAKVTPGARRSSR